MSLLTTINGIPLYSTIEEAMRWAVTNDLRSYHTHEFQGQIGYMGGADHAQATNPSTQLLTQPTRQAQVGEDIKKIK